VIKLTDLLDARPLGLVDRFPYDWWWTFALDRCYPPRRHLDRHTCRPAERRLLRPRITSPKAGGGAHA
jgi:hypothetical protein